MPGQRSLGGELSKDACRSAEQTPAELWSFELLVPLRLKISLNSAAFDPALTLYDKDCQVLFQNDDCSGSSLNSFVCSSQVSG